MFGKKDKLKSEDVMKALAEVTDPILEKDLVKLGMIKDVQVEKKTVRINVDLPTPAWEPQALLDQEIRRVAAPVVGDREIELAWGSNVRPARPEAMGGENLVPAARNILLFASGKGGVGKSTVATNVAAALSKQGANVGLLDADIYGPSIPTMLGTREKPTADPAGKKIVPITQYGMKLMSIGFIVDPSEAMTWRGPMLNGALLQFMRDVVWGDLDYLCLDLPPGTGDVQLTIAQNVKVAGSILVSTPQDVALADVTRAKSMFDRVDIPTMGVVENMSWFECGNCSTRHEIFSHGGAAKLASELDIPVLGEVPIELGVRTSGDAGKPEVLTNPDSAASKAFDAIARRIATELAKTAVAATTKSAGAGRLRIVM